MTDEGGTLLGNRPHDVCPPTNEIALMNWLIDGLNESRASGEQCNLECDIQKGVAGADGLVKWGREDKGGDGAFEEFLVLGIEGN